MVSGGLAVGSKPCKTCWQTFLPVTKGAEGPPQSVSSRAQIPTPPVPKASLWMRSFAMPSASRERYCSCINGTGPHR